MPIREPIMDGDRNADVMKAVRAKVAEAQVALDQAMQAGDMPQAMILVGVIAFGLVHENKEEIDKLKARITELEEKLAMYSTGER